MKNTCTVKDHGGNACGEYVVGGGLCRKHYMRLRRTGTTADPVKRVRPPCTHPEGCDVPQVGQGLCDKHYHREWAREHRGPRAPLPELTCTQCGKVYTPLRAPRGEINFHSKACKAAYRRISGRQAIAARKHYFKSKYGLTPEEVEEMAEEGCAICGTTEWVGAHGGTPHVDHDHVTGKVRGILCTNCNSGLGQFKDDATLLRAAIAYLERVPA